jgi:carbohydrate kinase (thermoresistant glucokinase family)
VEAVTDDFGVTRPMAREALQILHQKGLIDLQPRIGATVQALGEWDLLDRDVITWRLQEAPDSQMRSLTELREMIEPRAARLAAARRDAEICHDLISLAHRLRDLSVKPDFEKPNEGRATRKAFLEADIRFHRTLLRGSRNELLLRLSHPVETALHHRLEQNWAGWSPKTQAHATSFGSVKPYPRRPEPMAIWFHVGLAHAVDQGLVPAAEAFAEAILAEITLGRLEDRAVRNRLRAGLRDFKVSGLRAPDQAPFAAATNEIIQDTHLPVVVMGVSASGKSTVGKLLAASLRTPFVEGDSLHSEQNIATMEQGIPLDDRSRSPWLADIAAHLALTNGTEEGLVITCSALKRIYREVLRAANPRTLFVHLSITPAEATARAAARDSHFLPASLVASQFETLEPLEPDEEQLSLTIDATLAPLQIVSTIQARLAQLTAPTAPTN